MTAIRGAQALPIARAVVSGRLSLARVRLHKRPAGFGRFWDRSRPAILELDFRRCVTAVWLSQISLSRRFCLLKGGIMLEKSILAAALAFFFPPPTRRLYRRLR